MEVLKNVAAVVVARQAAEVEVALVVLLQEEGPVAALKEAEAASVVDRPAVAAVEAAILIVVEVDHREAALEVDAEPEGKTF